MNVMEQEQVWDSDFNFKIYKISFGEFKKDVFLIFLLLTRMQICGCEEIFFFFRSLSFSLFISRTLYNLTDQFYEEATNCVEIFCIYMLDKKYDLKQTMKIMIIMILTS